MWNNLTNIIQNVQKYKWHKNFSKCNWLNIQWNLESPFSLMIWPAQRKRPARFPDHAEGCSIVLHGSGLGKGRRIPSFQLVQTDWMCSISTYIMHIYLWKIFQSLGVKDLNPVGGQLDISGVGGRAMGIIFLKFEYLPKYSNRWISSAFRSDCDAPFFKGQPLILPQFCGSAYQCLSPLLTRFEMMMIWWEWLFNWVNNLQNGCF